ncbi:hypothetical protein MLD38_022853 [Melastoma candidum]|uniref:Uncharacterized protein n=1 Tax=Melastoma candidum TaxID=119954 RepID=A0ACB9QNP6_9MYRT|nr:hypothetical protein MLD38_022853 [Melastoma candidum]
MLLCRCFCFLSISGFVFLSGFALQSLTPRKEDNVIPQVPPTVAAVKNPSSKIVYDEYNHLCFPPAKDVLALASREVDLSSIKPGTTVTVKYHGKPVFIRRRTDEDMKLANTVDIGSLCDTQPDSDGVKNPKWLIMIGICTHLGCIPLPNAGDFGGWFCSFHGLHYDISGRIRKGPALYNLEVTTCSFLEENKLLIG